MHAGKGISEDAIPRMPAHHRTIGPDDEGIPTVGTLRWSPCQPQVTAHGLAVPVQERVLVINGSDHIYRAGLGRNHEAVAIFQLYVGQGVDSRCGLGNIEDHATSSANGAE